MKRLSVFTLVVLLLVVSSILFFSTTPDQPRRADGMDISETHLVAAHLEFAEIPELGSPVTVTLTITPTIDLDEATVTIDRSGSFTVLDAVPSGYDEADSVVSWNAEDLVTNTPYEFAVGVTSEEELTEWIVAEIFVDDYKRGGDALAVRLSESSSVTSLSGKEVFFNTYPQDVPDMIASSPFAVSLIWDHLIGAESATALVITATNITESTESFDGLLDLPTGWSIDTGSNPWYSGSISPGQTVTKTFGVSTGSNPGTWHVSIEVDPSSGDDYKITDIGGFDEDGAAYYDGQARERTEPESFAQLAQGGQTSTAPL